VAVGIIGGMWSQRPTRPDQPPLPASDSHPPDPVDGPASPGPVPALPHRRPPDDPIVVAPLDEVLAAIDGMDLDRPFEAIAPQVLPILRRRRPFPGEADPPVVRTWPPGLPTAFGVDLGPAFLYVGTWALAKWGVGEDALADHAIANLRSRVAKVGTRGLMQDAIGGLPMSTYQSREGWASSLLLVPDELVRLFGPEPSLILTPMRDLVVQLPIDSDLGVASWLLEDFAALDPGGLRVPLMALIDGELAMVTRESRDRVKAAARRGH